MGVTAYITDLDGTLCDTQAASIAAYHQAFKEAGLPFDEDIFRKFFGLRFDEMVQKLAPKSTVEQRQLIAERKSVHYPKKFELVTLNKPLLKVLEFAKSHGAKIGLATTARKKNASAILHHFSLHELFDATIFGEDVVHGKPHPECYKKAMEQLKSKPDETLIFEDSDKGIAAAQQAGAHVIKVAM
jgi:beta-phosphoglucomutase